ncbi:GNAT family N-acetyltransferase [Gorillibacterium massiliense]|uniref:GNAT family N-acetyltransferase n=1 Tax=Gorillibacterium massiliense TaxID=1280390 RepID=UPI0004B311BF|nr:GNAT family N-acetyltransferase [Gorillibacterium massiliense]
MISIRDAAATDVPAILDIYNEAVATSTATFDLEPQTLEARMEWFSHYGERYPLIVAELDGQVAGYCSLSQFRTKPAYNATVELSIYLGEKYHGQGIGTQLMNEIIKRSKAMGFHTIVACITVGNDGSVRFHERFGFELVATFKEVGYKFNRWLDVYFFQLMLDENPGE